MRAGGLFLWNASGCAIMDSEKVWRAGRRFAPRFFVKITVPGLEVWGGYFLYDPKENPTATANNTRPANPMTVSISMASPHFRGEIKPPASVHFSRLPPRSVRKRERHRRSLTAQQWQRHGSIIAHRTPLVGVFSCSAPKCYQKMIRFFQLHGIIFIKSMQFYDKKGDAYVRQIIQQGDGVFFQAG